MQYTSTDDDVIERKTQRIRVWLELGGSDGTGSVEVGQLTTLGMVSLYRFF